jgi:hypothetical protein
MEYASIPTLWNGTQYRSRLEAKWAVAFDKMRLEVRYESELIRLPSRVGYLPDFYVPLWDAYLEVKPTTTVDLSKPRELALVQPRPVYLAVGEPWRTEYLPERDNEEDDREPPKPPDLYVFGQRKGVGLSACRFIDCPVCEKVSVDRFHHNIAESLACRCMVNDALAVALFNPGVPAVLSGLVCSDPYVREAVHRKLAEWRKEPESHRAYLAFHAAREACFREGWEPEPVKEWEL